MPLFRPKRGTSGATPPASTLSIIASGMVVTGDIRCDGVLRIDGTLKGSILGARQLIVTRGGQVHGEVQAEEVVVGGEIDGNVRASMRLELQGTAVVNGNIETRAFVVPEGGRVNGDIRMIGGAGAGRAEPLRLPAPAATPVIASPLAPKDEAPEPEEVVREERRMPAMAEVPNHAAVETPLVVQGSPLAPRPLSKKERRKLKRNQ